MFKQKKRPVTERQIANGFMKTSSTLLDPSVESVTLSREELIGVGTVMRDYVDEDGYARGLLVGGAALLIAGLFAKLKANRDGKRQYRP